MALGALFAVVGYMLLSIDHGSLGVFETFLALAYFGIGFAESSTRVLVVDQLRDGEVAIGEGIYELAITVGSAVGAAVFAADHVRQRLEDPWPVDRARLRADVGRRGPGLPPRAGGRGQAICSPAAQKNAAAQSAAVPVAAKENL